MTDILIRGLTPDEVRRLDQRARELGLSRQDLLRRTIQREINAEPVRLTMKDLEDFAGATRDLADPDVMRRAWE